MNNASPLPLLAKRFMDICGGIIGCLITLVLIIIIGPVIYFASPGPIFSRRSESAEMAESSRCTNSEACIWMQRKEKKN